jgi:hypothetical protein
VLPLAGEIMTMKRRPTTSTPSGRVGGHGRAAPKPVSDGHADLKRSDHPAQVSDLPRLGEMAEDDHEALVISLARFVFAGYCSGRLEAWDHGFEAADHVLGERDGVVFFAGVLALGRAIKAERCDGFHFLPPSCCHIAEDEIELLAALQAARRRDESLLRSALVALARQPAAPRIQRALRGLADLVSAMAADCADAEHPPVHETPTSKPVLH